MEKRYPTSVKRIRESVARRRRYFRSCRSVSFLPLKELQLLKCLQKEQPALRYSLFLRFRSPGAMNPPWPRMRMFLLKELHYFPQKE